MRETITAVFENGVLRPLKPLPLAEKTVVQISIEPAGPDADELTRILDRTFDGGVLGPMRREDIYADRG